jgi:hypothetical protein
MQTKIKTLTFEQIFQVMPNDWLISKDATLLIDNGDLEWAYRQGSDETALDFFHRILWSEVQKERQRIGAARKALERMDFESWRYKNDYPHDATEADCLTPHLEIAIATLI